MSIGNKEGEGAPADGPIQLKLGHLLMNSHTHPEQTVIFFCRPRCGQQHKKYRSRFGRSPCPSLPAPIPSSRCACLELIEDHVRMPCRVPVVLECAGLFLKRVTTSFLFAGTMVPCFRRLPPLSPAPFALHVRSVYLCVFMSRRTSTRTSRLPPFVFKHIDDCRTTSSPSAGRLELQLHRAHVLFS